MWIFFSSLGFWGLDYKTTTQNHSVGGACLPENSGSSSQGLYSLE